MKLLIRKSVFVIMDERTNPLVTEYLDLLIEVLEKYGTELPEIVETGLSTYTQKLNVDTLDLIRTKHEAITAAKLRLLTLDEEYEKALQNIDANATEPEENASRVADFVAGLVLSFNGDFTKSPDLMHAMQQIYLFRQVMDCT